MIIAVDTGATKTLVAAFEGGKLVRSQKFATPRNQQEYLEAVIKAITALTSKAKITAVSVAVAGVVRDNIAVVCKNLGWRNFDILSGLQAHFPGSTMFLENDANLGGVGAANLLSKTRGRLLYLGIGTGLGGGFTIDGRVDPTTSIGEFSDIHFEYDGKMTRWGEILSGKAIFRDFGLYANELSNTQHINEVARRISRGLLVTIPILRPEVIAFGGRAGAEFDKFRATVEANLSILPEQYRCQLITAPNPEEIVVYGCYFQAVSRLADR